MAKEYAMILKKSVIVYKGPLDYLVDILHDNMESENPNDYDFYEKVNVQLVRELKVIPEKKVVNESKN